MLKTCRFCLRGMDKVINCFNKCPDASVRLICFPWAGGGSMHYARWANSLNSSIEGKSFIKRDRYIIWFDSEFGLFWCQFVFSCLFAFAVYSVRLPGREGRAKEPFFKNMEELLDEVISVLLPQLKEKPFALFGHRYMLLTCF